MGQQLAHPIRNKELRRRGNAHIRGGLCSMHGYRLNMEDRHVLQIPQWDRFPAERNQTKNKLAIVGVFDGHDGAEASEFLQKKLAKAIGHLYDPTDPIVLSALLLLLDQRFAISSPRKNAGSTVALALIRYQAVALDTDSKFIDVSTNIGNDVVAAEAVPAAGTIQQIEPLPERPYKVTIVNVGDSRAMLIDKKTGSIRYVTEDHKPNHPEERKRILKAGGYIEANRVNGSLALSRAFGDWSYKSKARTQEGGGAMEQAVICIPKIDEVSCGNDDVLLVACDGIFEKMSNEEVAQFIVQECKTILHDPAAVMARLCERSLFKGSKDNMTCALITFGQDGSGALYDKHRQANEYLAGPYLLSPNESRGSDPLNRFDAAYRGDAKRNGLNEEQTQKLIDEYGKVLGGILLAKEKIYNSPEMVIMALPPDGVSDTTKTLLDEKAFDFK